MKIKLIISILVAVGVFVVAGFYVNNKMHFMPFGDTAEVKSRPSDTGKPAEKIDFQDYGKAPEFVGIANWLNSETLTMASLKGKVVLIDFWTYSCINCIRTFPYVTKWYDTYKDKGFVVVGVHTPEFAFEKDSGNVQDAIKRFGIHYPVAQDNDYATWQAYSNRYWPAEYLVDKNGTVVYTHFGEGNYDITENAIRTLLGMDATSDTKNPVPAGEVKSPEMYLGTERLANLTPSQKPSTAPKTYTLPSELALNYFALGGNWQFSTDNIKLVSGQGKLRLKFHSGKLHMVAASTTAAKLTIIVDGKSQPDVTVKNSELYTLFDSDSYTDHVIEIIIDTPGFEGFTFTFG